jgi:hypothetical protein
MGEHLSALVLVPIQGDYAKLLRELDPSPKPKGSK